MNFKPHLKKRWTSIGHTWLDPVVVNRSQMGLHSSLPIPFSEPGFKPLIESIEENNRINPPSLFNLLNPFRLLFLIVRDYWFSTIQSDYRGHPKCPPRQISGVYILHFHALCKFHWLCEACVIVKRSMPELGPLCLTFTKIGWLDTDWRTTSIQVAHLCVYSYSYYSIISSGLIRQTATQKLLSILRKPFCFRE